MSSTHTEITRWSAEEFETLVLSKKPKSAVFDCDGTLWSGDSGHGFMVWSMAQGLVSRSTCDWMDTRYRAYLAGAVTEAEICGNMVQMYAGLRESELRSAAAKYFDNVVRGREFAEIKALVTSLRQTGTELWAVSSTNKWVVSEGVRDFGIPAEKVLAAEVAVNDGIITSEIIEVPTGPAKAVALQRVGLVHPDAVFGNSIHDLAMMEIAAHAFPVNPSPALIEAATKQGWGYFRPRAADDTGAAVGGE